MSCSSAPLPPPAPPAAQGEAACGDLQRAVMMRKNSFGSAENLVFLPEEAGTAFPDTENVSPHPCGSGSWGVGWGWNLSFIFVWYQFWSLRRDSKLQDPFSVNLQDFAFSLLSKLSCPVGVGPWWPDVSQRRAPNHLKHLTSSGWRYWNWGGNFS